MNLTAHIRSLLAISIIALISFSINGCFRRSKLEIDTSNIKVNTKFRHFEEALASIPDTLFFQEFPKVYPGFAPLFMMKTCDSLIMTEMLLFKTDAGFKELYARKKEVLGDLQQEKEAILSVLQHYRYYYPNAPEHTIITHISGLDISLLESPVILNDTLAIISTDLFLGKDFEPYKLVGIPEYKKRWMCKEMMPVEFARQLAVLQAGSGDEIETLLDQMLYHGKILYFTDAMMPETDDTLKIRYTGDQLEWMLENQKNVWAYLVNNRMLYASDQNHTKLLIMDAPFTSNFTEMSPGRIGQWFGWQIVKKYMTKHPDVTLQQLMQETDTKKLLQESGYKPG